MVDAIVEVCVCGAEPKVGADLHGDAAASWPLATWRNDVSLGVVALAGIDLDALRRHGAQSDVRIRSVAPWWHHAFVEARRCVPNLVQAPRAQVCVVEGRSAAWIALSHGTMSHLRRCVLEDATVDALRSTIAHMSADAAGETTAEIHGLLTRLGYSIHDVDGGGPYQDIDSMFAGAKTRDGWLWNWVCL